MSDVRGIDEHNWILTLFIRDDGERFLLGDGAYEFKDSHLHFEADAITNDTVDVQGSDGILLAGQVRRPTTQSFDGYVGTATATKEQIEQKRRAFIGFFLPRHTYTAIYIFTNGKAIQRKRGFLVDYPEVKELFQIHPEYHVALNFEDVNYYNYSEDEEGKEIYSSIYKLINTRATSGGLVWDEIGIVWDEMQAGGKNLFDKNAGQVIGGYFGEPDNVIVIGVASRNRVVWLPCKPNTTYTLSDQSGIDGLNPRWVATTEQEPAGGVAVSQTLAHDSSATTITTGADAHYIVIRYQTRSNTSVITDYVQDILDTLQVEEGSEATPYEPFIHAGGAVWESGSGETENNINVESIETVYPVLTIVGRATDITIENIRTGDTLEYLGTVSEGQTLVIDMGNQTAKLNGVNVLSNISGDWIRLASGLNRVLYDANVDEVSSATLEWQEIVA